MAKFGEWVFIVHGCEMPKEGEHVLVTIVVKNEFDGGPSFNSIVNDGSYFKSRLRSIPSRNGIGGFVVDETWVGWSPLKVVAWMPMPKPCMYPITDKEVKKMTDDVRKAFEKVKLTEKKPVKTPEPFKITDLIDLEKLRKYNMAARFEINTRSLGWNVTLLPMNTDDE